MMSHEELHEHEYGEGTYPREWYTGWRRMSWGAILAGLVVALGIFLTLQILGAGIGLSTINLTGRQTPSAGSLGIGAAIWSFVFGLVLLFVGGWVAGRFAWQPNRTQRILHGLTMWAFFYIIMFGAATNGSRRICGQTVHHSTVCPGLQELALQGRIRQGHTSARMPPVTFEN